MTLAAVNLSRRPPDVVLVDPTGKSTYVPLRTATGEVDQRPSPHTVAHFARDFLFRFLAVNSSTIHAAWPEALSMMTPGLRAQMERLAAEQKLLETYRAAQVRTDIELEQLELVEQLERAVHVRAVVLRRKQPLAGGPVTTDRLHVDLIADVVPRSASSPDGLQVAEYRNSMPPPVQASSSTEPSYHGR
jgi:hypothetical protein